MTIKEAIRKIGGGEGLSKPSKMPCYSYSIPAQRCIVGSRLRKVKGSTCSKCYALKGNYTRFPKVGEALERRFQALTQDLEGWTEAMIFMITRREKSGFFRWHDAGDLQSVDHLRAICTIAEATPHITHWLPSREYTIVRKYLLQHGDLPSNLTVRLSAHMVGEYNLPTIKGVVWSTVGSEAPEGFHNCPSSQQGGKCLDCRACWDKTKTVNYLPH